MEQTSPISLTPPESRKLNKANIVMACLMVLMLGAAATFGILWGIERNKPPKVIEEPVVDCQSDSTKCQEDGAASSDYIYIGQWGIKIKIPENLKNLRYSYRGEGSDRFEYSDGTIKIFDHESQVSVSGTAGIGDGTVPDFASHSESGLGTVSRYKKETYDCEDASCPTHVTTIGDYEYYYNHPQTVISQSQSDTEWEKASVELIQTMLTNLDNYTVF